MLKGPEILKRQDGEIAQMVGSSARQSPLQAALPLHLFNFGQVASHHCASVFLHLKNEDNDSVEYCRMNELNEMHIKYLTTVPCKSLINGSY